MLSVAAIVACVCAVVRFVYFVFSYTPPQHLHLIASLVTLGLISLGTLEILARLSAGQGGIAALLAGRPIGRDSGRDDEQRLVNIVDELAIASGLAAPPLYVLNREQGINAFAAGDSPSQAVIVVTQGALEQLSRDELQAVIAHEFSHILNGDIRLNLRAVYVLQGIVFLSAIGRFMMRYYSGAGTEEGRSFFNLPLAAVGVGVFAVGSVGLLFCRIIQASISRERENLADASAVRFTRNADALCGALARIQASADGSRLRNWHGDALAHMLFAPPSPNWLSAFIATHPPVEERMRRINPHVSPLFYFDKARRPRVIEESTKEVAVPEKEKPATILPRRLTNVAALVASIGEPGVEHLEYATGLLAYLSAPIREALGDPVGAQAVMFGCLLDEELTNRERQLRALRSHDMEALSRKAEVIAPHLRQLDRAYRLALIALAAPALKRLDETGRAVFLAALRALIQADERVTLSEFVLATILDWTIGPHAKRAGGTRFKQRAELAPETALVLSLLAHCGSEDAKQVQVAFDKGRDAAGMPELALEAKEKLQFTQVSLAFVRLAQLAGAEKERLLQGFGAAIAADGNVRLMEHELLRAVACVLDCPMPPQLAAIDPRLLRK